VAGALAVHPGALGDVLLAVPALRALRATVPGPLVLAAQPRVAALLRALGVVDEGVRFEALALDALFTEDGHPAPRLAAASRVVCWFGARDPDFVRRLRAVAPAAVVAPSVGAEGPVWEHLLRTVGAPGGDWRAPLAVSASLRAAGRAALEAAGWDGTGRVLIVHPGAGGAGKRWPVDALGEAVATLAGRHGLTVVVHQGPADGDAVSALGSRLGVAPRLLKEPDLDVLAGALAEAALYLGSDSGVSHLAAAAGAPVLVLFREVNLAWRPWHAGACVVLETASGPLVDAAAALLTGAGRPACGSLGRR
jgi:ADP-heptose:LPS heptosyltransferase